MTDIHKRMNAKLFDEKAALLKENAALRNRVAALKTALKGVLTWANNLDEVPEQTENSIIEMLEMLEEMK